MDWKVIAEILKHAKGNIIVPIVVGVVLGVYGSRAVSRLDSIETRLSAIEAKIGLRNATASLHN